MIGKYSTRTGFLSQPVLLLLALVVLDAGCTRVSSGETRSSTALVVWMAEAETTVTRYRDLAVVGNQVWALSSSAPFLHRFSVDGALLGASIGAGDGPGEMRLPLWIVTRKDPSTGTAIAHVIHRQRELVAIAEDGEPSLHASPFAPGGGPVVLRVFELAYGQPGQIRALSPNRFLVQWQILPTVQNASDISDALLLLVDSTATPIDTVAHLTTLVPERTSARVSMFLPVPLWGVCNEHEVAVYSPKDDEVVWYSPDGGTLRRRSAGMPVRDVSTGDRLRYARLALEVEARRPGSNIGALPSLQVLVGQMTPGFARTTPPAVGLLCEPDGTVWLQQFDTADDARGFGRSWRGVPPSGETRQLEMPARFYARASIDGAFYGWIEDTDGVQRIAKVSTVQAESSRLTPQ